MRPILKKNALRGQCDLWPIVQASTCVEDVVKAILQKSLGLLRPTLDHRVAVLQQDDLVTHVCLSAVSHTRLRTQTYLG